MVTDNNGSAEEERKKWFTRVSVYGKLHTGLWSGTWDGRLRTPHPGFPLGPFFIHSPPHIDNFRFSPNSTKNFIKPKIFSYNYLKMPARSPPFIKGTPGNNSELLPIWQSLYNELTTTYCKSRTLEIIGLQHDVSRQTVMYHLVPEYKEKQKNYPSKKWAYEKQDPVIHEKRIAYKARYHDARNHIDDLIRKSYQQMAPQKAMTHENLVYAIHKITGIFFRPSTLLGLSCHYETQKGYPLLKEVPGYDVPHYELSNEALK